MLPQESFEKHGRVERVKKIKDYAFVHFEDRDHAILAMENLDGKELGGSHIEVRTIGVKLNSDQLYSDNFVSTSFFPRYLLPNHHPIKRKRKKFYEQEKEE